MDSYGSHRKAIINHFPLLIKILQQYLFMWLPLRIPPHLSLLFFKSIISSCYSRLYSSLKVLNSLSQESKFIFCLLELTSWCNSILAFFHLLTHNKINYNNLHIYFIQENMKCQFQEIYSTIFIVLGSTIKSGHSKCLIIYIYA